MAVLTGTWLVPTGVLSGEHIEDGRGAGGGRGEGVQRGRSGSRGRGGGGSVKRVLVARTIWLLSVLGKVVLVVWVVARGGGRGNVEL